MAGAEYRAATPADAAVVAELFDMAVGGLAMQRWAERAGEGADVLAFAHKLVAEGEGRLSSGMRPSPKWMARWSASWSDVPNRSPDSSRDRIWKVRRYGP